MRQPEPGVDNPQGEATNPKGSPDAQDTPDANEKIWRELVRATSRYQPSEARKARVLRRLQEAPDGRPWASPMRRPMFAFAMAVAIVAVVGAVASAATGGWFARLLPASAVRALAPTPVVPAPRPPTRARSQPIPEPVPIASPPAAPTPQTATPAVTTPTPPAQVDASVQRDHKADVAAIEQDESEKLHAAAKALRRHRDPKRALELLNAYFSKYPDGILREEATRYQAEATSMLRTSHKKTGPATPEPTPAP